jgi:hypothetical protein
MEGVIMNKNRNGCMIFLILFICLGGTSINGQPEQIKPKRILGIFGG